MTDSSAKTCCLCHKDVSAEKHIKDKRGRYYCNPCYAAAVQQRERAAQAAQAPASAQAANPAAKPAAPQGIPVAQPVAGPSQSSDDDMYDLKDEPAPKARPAATPAAAAQPAAAPAASMPLPEICPACGAKMLAGRKICIKCNRDVTKLDKLLAIRAQQEAEAEKGASTVEAAEWIGKVAKVGMWVVIVGVVVFILWGVYMMFFPGGNWDGYPTRRETAVREFLQHIATGTEKSYDKAFMLISWRERATGVSDEDKKYKITFRKMHEEFDKKYGKDWISKIKLENIGADDVYPDDDVIYLLTIGEDKYHISTQVQMDATTAVANITAVRKDKLVFDEDGQNRFGIIDVHEYRVNKHRHMSGDVTGIHRREKPDPEGLIPIEP